MPNQQIDDDITRATARLPGLDVEIVHRRSPAADAIESATEQRGDYAGRPTKKSTGDARVPTPLASLSVCQWLPTMSLSISSIECGEIPSSPSPGMSGLDVLSICISST